MFYRTIEAMPKPTPSLIESGRVAKDCNLGGSVQAGIENPHTEMDVKKPGSNKSHDGENARGCEKASVPVGNGGGKT